MPEGVVAGPEFGFQSGRGQAVCQDLYELVGVHVESAHLLHTAIRC